MNQDEAPILNVNAAEEEELRQLPGVGPQLAGRIIEGRPYESIEDMQEIPGLGDSVLDSIEPFITFQSNDEGAEAEGDEASEKEPASGRADPTPLEYPMVVSEAKPQGVGIWALLAMGAASVLCSVTLSLAIIVGINGTLNYGRHAAVLETKSELRQLRSQLETMQSETEALRGRAEALEGMSGRMVEVESQVTQLNEQIDEALLAVDDLQVELEAALEETRAQADRVDRFQSFLEGLGRLLGQIVPQP